MQVVLGEGDTARVAYIDDMAVRVRAGNYEAVVGDDPDGFADRLVEAIQATQCGCSDVDPLNRLVIAAGLGWSQVVVLRGYLRYWSQVVASLDLRATADSLVAYPTLTAALISYFEARFDPQSEGSDLVEGPGGGFREVSTRDACVEQLAGVTHLDDDRVLRGVLGLIDATWRTNYFTPSMRAAFAAFGFRAQRAGSWGPPGRPAPIVLKLDGRRVPEAPSPRPEVETFVHSTALEGIHLRAGRIARGGIRWSERPDDFRTEVADLAFAQVKKNSVIVPTGAKGGFVVRYHPDEAAPSAAWRRPSFGEVADAYETFISSLLAITDNFAGTEVVPPSGVRAADAADPYLVVAADKGTASFSDLANSIAERVGFWLGDAFASGGSHGYDHKAMGITAKGAWVAVARHFKELGIDVSKDRFRVVGVGDMSGDVFGNGMIQSSAIELVAAFDHRHIFVDPNPDPLRSFEERCRLAALARSSWDDYDRDAISPGGGVWSRADKTVHVSAEAAVALGLSEGEVSPPQLISAILKAPVDLLWFGGIGTFLKAPEEADSDVADHANDATRVTSDQVRARVIGEGANLGVTQKARVGYSRRGGRVNADFIDNAAGVATSDREVNLKILLTAAAEEEGLSMSERDGYLARAEPAVAAAVLAQVDHSVVALNRAAKRSDRDLDAYESLVASLERNGLIDRASEVLPDVAEFEVRRKAGAGLIRPELATLLAYAKSDIVVSIEASGAAGDPIFLDSVEAYFPPEFRRDFAKLIPAHRLYEQIAATGVAGEMVDRMGIVWAHDLADELGCRLADVSVAFWVARRVCDAERLWELLADRSPSMDPAVEAELHSEIANAVERLARRYLLQGGVGDAELRAARDVAAGEEVGACLAASLDAREIRVQIATASRRIESIDLAVLASKSARGVDECRRCLEWLRHGVADRLEATLTEALDASPPPSRVLVWQARAVLDDLDAWLQRAATWMLEQGQVKDDPTSVLAPLILDALAVLDSAPERAADRVAAGALVVRRLHRGLP
jgi:glutamate dehydrogenase